MNEILPHLYLGDIEASQDFEAINEHKIKHIISILSQKEFLVPTKSHLLINLNDGEPFPEDALNQGVNFIKNALKNKEGILVHCMAGISRSTTLISAYFMKELKFTPDYAIKFLQEKREIIDPAYFTFKSAIEWSFPDQQMFCSVCNKIWDYREKFEFYDFKALEENLGVRNIKDCSCDNPIVILKPFKNGKEF
jgi:hypothetical protein